MWWKLTAQKSLHFITRLHVYKMPVSRQQPSINITHYCVTEWAQPLHYVIIYSMVTTTDFFHPLKKQCDLGQMVRFVHRGPQSLPPRARITTKISNVERNKHCSRTDIYEIMNKSAYSRNKNSHRWKENQVKQLKKKAENRQIYLNHSGPFPNCPFPSPSIQPLFSLPVLYSSSGAIFPPLLSPLFSLPSFCLSRVSLWAYVWWYQCSRTPPLTDNSLDGTLLCTVQCTVIRLQWALGLWWMERIPPICGEW